MNKGRKRNCCILRGEGREKKSLVMQVLISLLKYIFHGQFHSIDLVKTSSHFSYNFNTSIFHIQKMKKQKGQISSR